MVKKIEEVEVVTEEAKLPSCDLVMSDDKYSYKIYNLYEHHNTIAFQNAVRATMYHKGEGVHIVLEDGVVYEVLVSLVSTDGG